MAATAMIMIHDSYMNACSLDSAMAYTKLAQKCIIFVYVYMLLRTTFHCKLTFHESFEYDSTTERQ